MKSFEKEAMFLWIGTLDGYDKYTCCHGCGEMKQCRGKTQRRFLCLECFDLGVK